MRPRTALFGVLGVFATGVGVGLLVAPERLRAVGPVEDAVTAAAAVETTTVGLVAGVLVLLALLATARSQPTSGRNRGPSSVDSRFERAAIAPPERPGAEGTVAGGTLDHDIEQAVLEGDDAFRDVRAVLAQTATAVHAERMGVPESDAAAAVERGEWTDDPVAARFLGDAEPPLAMRMRRWLVPERERRRRIERTVAAIERVSPR